MIKKLFINITTLVLISTFVFAPNCNHKHNDSCHYDPNTNTCTHVHTDDCKVTVGPHFIEDEPRG